MGLIPPGSLCWLWEGPNSHATHWTPMAVGQQEACGHPIAFPRLSGKRRQAGHPVALGASQATWGLQTAQWCWEVLVFFLDLWMARGGTWATQRFWPGPLRWETGKRGCTRATANLKFEGDIGCPGLAPESLWHHSRGWSLLSPLLCWHHSILAWWLWAFEISCHSKETILNYHLTQYKAVSYVHINSTESWLQKHKQGFFFIPSIAHWMYMWWSLMLRLSDMKIV